MSNSLFIHIVPRLDEYRQDAVRRSGQDERKIAMITVNDIREKEFGRQKHGYNEEAVDDFLDEIADQMEALVRENRALMQQTEEIKARMAQMEQRPAQAAPAAAPAPAPVPEPVAAPVEPAPVADEPYFRNLEATLRETLLSAQRIAEQTVAEAREKAKALVDEAETQAQSITENAHTEMEGAQAELAGVRKAVADYRARFRTLVQEQMRALKIEEDAQAEADQAEE